MKFKVELSDVETERLAVLAERAGDAQMRGTKRSIDKAAVMLYRVIEAGLAALENPTPATVSVGAGPIYTIRNSPSILGENT